MRQLFICFASVKLTCQNAEIVARESTTLIEPGKQLYLSENNSCADWSMS